MRQEARVEGQKTEQVYQKDGKWLMRAYLNQEGVEIPADVAQIIKTALRIAKMSGLSKNKKARDLSDSVNCHRAVFYAMGLINRDDPKEGTELFPHYEYPLFPVEEFNHYSSVDFLKSFLRESLENNLGIVQIVGHRNEDKGVHFRGAGDGTPTLAHSFLAKFDSSGEVICFEKVDYRPPVSGVDWYGPTFQVVDLEKIYDRYGTLGYWDAGKLDSIKEGDSVRFMRAHLDGHKDQIGNSNSVD